MEKRARRTRWTSRTAVAVCFVLAVAVSTTYAGTATLSDSTPTVADDGPGDPSATRNFATDLDALSERISKDLDARVKLKTDAIVQQASDKQMAKLLRNFEQNLAMSREISKRVDRQLAALAD